MHINKIFRGVSTAIVLLLPSAAFADSEEFIEKQVAMSNAMEVNGECMKTNILQFLKENGAGENIVLNPQEMRSYESNKGVFFVEQFIASEAGNITVVVEYAEMAENDNVWVTSISVTDTSTGSRLYLGDEVDHEFVKLDQLDTRLIDLKNRLVACGVEGPRA